MRKKLLVLTSTFPRWQGDVEPRFVYDLCLRLTADFDVTVISPHTRGARQEETLQGVRVYRYRYAPDNWENLAYAGGISEKLKANKLNYLLLPVFFLAQYLSIRKIVKRHSIDIIHAHWLIPQGMLAIVSRCCSRKKLPILCTSHGGDLFGLVDPLGKSIKRWVIKRVEGLSVVSHTMISKLDGLIDERSIPCCVIPMGTDLRNTFIPDSDKTRNPYQLLFVGRLVEKKGLEYLVKCLPSLLKKFPDIKLMVAGVGPEQAAIKLLADKSGVEERVIFSGSLSHEALVDLYQDSAMSIFPFVQAENGDMEGLGLVMVEALGCECPVIAGDVPAVYDVIENEVSGLIVNPKHTAALERAITQILNNQERAQDMARRGREHVLEKFSWESVAKRYSELLNKIARS